VLLDIGPSILVTHGDGIIFAWMAAAERPALVKGVAAIEQAAQSVQVLTPQQLAKLAGVPISIVSADASPSSSTDPNIAAALRSAGAVVDHIRLADRGIRGNGPMVISERNNRDVLQPVLDWMRDRAESAPADRPAAPAGGGAPAVIPSADTNRNAEFTGMRLADQGGFFVGIRHKPMPYGTIPQGQMFVQYMIYEQRSIPSLWFTAEARREHT
jgi:pimeloyl-ACP methyl ester carboxylesterase